MARSMPAPGDRLTLCGGGIDRLALAYVIGPGPVAAGVVAHRHSLPAHPADGQPLQQRRPLPGRTAAPVRAVRLGVGPQLPPIGFKALPGDVPRVAVGQQNGPVGLRQPSELNPTVGAPALSAAPVDEGAGVSRVVQHLQRARVGQ